MVESLTASTQAPLMLWIVSPDVLVRQALSWPWREIEGYRILGTSEPSLSALQDAWEHGVPDLLLWDYHHTQHEAEIWGALAIPVLALVASPTQAPLALQAGARGVLLRDGNVEQMAQAAQSIQHNLLVWDEAFAPYLLQEPPSPAPELVEELTPREEEVLDLLAEGMANKEIAQLLEISEHTVKFHVNSIRGKLGAQTRTEAVVRAARLGLLHLMLFG